jgi:hypothetical protein
MGSLWYYGAARYERALEAELNQRIAQLDQELKHAASVDEVDRLKEQIRQERQQHRERLRKANRSLF